MPTSAPVQGASLCAGFEQLLASNGTMVLAPHVHTQHVHGVRGGGKRGLPAAAGRQALPAAVASGATFTFGVPLKADDHGLEAHIRGMSANSTPANARAHLPRGGKVKPKKQKRPKAKPAKLKKEKKEKTTKPGRGLVTRDDGAHAESSASPAQGSEPREEGGHAQAAAAGESGRAQSSAHLQLYVNVNAGLDQAAHGTRVPEDGDLYDDVPGAPPCPDSSDEEYDDMQAFLRPLPLTPTHAPASAGGDRGGDGDGPAAVYEDMEPDMPNGQAPQHAGPPQSPSDSDAGSDVVEWDVYSPPTKAVQDHGMATKNDAGSTTYGMLPPPAATYGMVGPPATAKARSSGAVQDHNDTGSATYGMLPPPAATYGMVGAPATAKARSSGAVQDHDDAGSATYGMLPPPAATYGMVGAPAATAKARSSGAVQDHDAGSATYGMLPPPAATHGMVGPPATTKARSSGEHPARGQLLLPTEPPTPLPAPQSCRPGQGSSADHAEAPPRSSGAGTTKHGEAVDANAWYDGTSGERWWGTHSHPHTHTPSSSRKPTSVDRTTPKVPQECVAALHQRTLERLGRPAHGDTTGRAVVLRTAGKRLGMTCGKDPHSDSLVVTAVDKNGQVHGVITPHSSAPCIMSLALESMIMTTSCASTPKEARWLSSAWLTVLATPRQRLSCTLTHVALLAPCLPPPTPLMPSARNPTRRIVSASLPRGT